MDLDQNQANIVSPERSRPKPTRERSKRKLTPEPSSPKPTCERSKRKPTPESSNQTRIRDREYYNYTRRIPQNVGAQIIKIDKNYFMKTVLRLTGCPQKRHLDMFRPRPLTVDNRRPSIIHTTTVHNPFLTDVTTSAVASWSRTSRPSLLSQPLFPPPVLPREKEAREAKMAATLKNFENNLMEDDTNQEQFSGLWSPLASLVPNGDVHQQRESIPPPPPPVPVLPDSRNDQGSENIPPPPIPTSAPVGSLEWYRSSINLLKNSPIPSVPTSAPTGSLDMPSAPNGLLSSALSPPIQPVSETLPLWSVDFPNPLSDIREENVPPPAPVTSSLWSQEWPHFSNDLQLENVSATSLFGSQDLPNSTNDQQLENVQPLVPATSPLINLDWLNDPLNDLQRESILLDWPYSPTNITFPTFMLSPTFLPSPTTGLLPNIN
ncbi:PREDICTED: serine/threonine-protein kinase ste20 [Camelina sativa]|uniref:Serine/threonine-protein kinase ste20 n=1 Tax=Camelina sativa TaxID=90675 RepID=A0ABM0WXB2_CAMSA|nr:PREDICTED: serine/threonine-protein kinase ste20 [Camelina sativa]